MSFGTATRRFALQVSRHRADNFAGRTADGDADADGNTHALATGTKFRAVITKLTTFIDVRVHGKSLRCTAKLIVQRSLDLTVDGDSVITDLRTKETFMVGQIGIDHPIAEELAILLVRVEQ